MFIHCHDFFPWVMNEINSNVMEIHGLEEDHENENPYFHDQEIMGSRVFTICN